MTLNEAIQMVAIKDIEMPRKCLSCPLSHFTVSARGKYYTMCSILHQRISSKTRLSDCPLVEIQERKVENQQEVICNRNAMSDELQAKLDKIEQITNKWISLEEKPNFCMMEIREILERD